MLIETHSLTKRFGNHTAVDRLDMGIEAGEAFGLLGRNGAGKTIVIKMLTTLLEPTSGSATIGGCDIVRDAAAVRRQIGYVPQTLSADGDLTGHENLSIFAKLYDIPYSEHKSRIGAALEMTDLAPFADKLVKSYSDGMIRRLEIAQSTLHRPRALFLDEPTVGLDPVARVAVWELLERLQAESGCAILLSTHYLEEAEYLCRRVAIMERGIVAAMGSPNALKAGLGPQATFSDVFAHYTHAGDAAVADDEIPETRLRRHVVDTSGWHSPENAR
ncbi:MAG TPA: ATP-binding cassette domain-containing protein [Burkholderiaceae bacterium]